MLRIGAARVLGASLVIVASEARAADSGPLPITLAYSDCDALDRAELEKLLAIEFQTLNVQAATPVEGVLVACGPNVARVTIDAASTVNEVELAATAPAAWPRLLALSVSEIVIASRARVTKAPAPPVPPAPPPLELPPARPVVIPAAPRVRLFAGAALRRAVRSQTWLAGPELGVAFDWTTYLSLAADVRAEFGSTETDLAHVRWTSTRGALTGLVGARFGAVRLGVGPGFCLGYLRLSPSVSVPNATGHDVSGLWGGPELVARALYDFSAHGFVQASIDSGIVTWPVAGLVDGERHLVDAGGAWLGGGLSVGALF